MFNKLLICILIHPRSRFIQLYRTDPYFHFNRFYAGGADVLARLWLDRNSFMPVLGAPGQQRFFIGLAVPARDGLGTLSDSCPGLVWAKCFVRVWSRLHFLSVDTDEALSVRYKGVSNRSTVVDISAVLSVFRLRRRHIPAYVPGCYGR